mmetsp:Transcript_5995/g.10787  ORF Transcript_5995/g.10787 Transcript_5995/m.10787 type:complete len:346 (-) Transcript_5995:92-1129(-)|eukprot:CAMPEP_0183736574 /NCGR_PEP_ID=MMETSP0737-20130205/49623_1 /TAXON_ID=385413 /ORGANISM="Thalassiosira miniscula, Strain CCMP1093" /LENGTH=345 /DNA_ID=CAMNT_0025970613 /DNA_START=225 /DNA_END=1262 /DNA_ORIENTATION=+
MTGHFSSSDEIENAAAQFITGKLSSIDHSYDVIRDCVLGTGHCATVHECVNRSTGQRYAVKTINKNDPRVKLSYLRRELSLLQEMKHDNIVRLVDVFEDQNCLHLVTELAMGGDLFGKIVQQEKASRISANENAPRCFPEDEVASILRQLLTAVSYLQSQDIVHRDIKPENIVFDTTKEDLIIKLVDFGLSRKHYQNSFEPYMSDILGSSYYVAPEVLSRKYNKSCDLWAVGVIGFLMFTGYPPFQGRTDNEVIENIRRSKLRFNPEHWKNVSKEAKDFIRKLLKTNPKKRMTAEKALNHPWILKQSTKQEEKSCVKAESNVMNRKKSILSVVNKQKLIMSMFHQ